MPSRRLKTLVVLALAILTNGAGNLCLSYGMKSVGAPGAWTPPGLWDVIGTGLSSAPVIVGGVLMLIFFALFLSLLSWAWLLSPTTAAPSTASGTSAVVAERFESHCIRPPSPLSATATP